MAKPYFTGDYGSALARVDTRPYMEAARYQADAIRGVGANVGGMIQQYGLNKEKRAKLTGEVEALYKEHPELLVQIGMSGDEAQDKKDITERERFLKGDSSIAQLEGLVGKLARGEVLRDKKVIRELNSAQLESAQYLNQQREESASNLNNAFDALDSTQKEIQGFIDSGVLKSKDLPAGWGRIINNPSLLKSRTPEALKFFASDPTKDAESALRVKTLSTNLLLGAEQINKLRREIELLGVNDTQERRKIEAQIGGLEAAADRDLAEAEVLRKQSRGRDDIIDPTTPGADEPSAFEVDPKLGAQGDLAGKLKGTINYLGDFLFGETAFEKDKDAKARVNALRMQLMPAFIGTLSDKGAEWALKEVEDIIPGVNDTDGAFRSKMQQLPSILAKKLEVDRNTVKFKLGTASQQLQAAQNAQQFPGLIISLKDILEERSRASQGGKTSTNIKFEYIEE
jgi:hypothetical protein